MGIDRLAHTMRELPRAVLDAWAGGETRRLPETVVTRSDDRYVDLNRGLNQRWIAQPQQIRIATRTEHIVRTVQDAVRRGRRLTIRSGGNCYENFVYSPDTEIVLDLSQLTEIGYDPRHNAISVGAGALLAQVYATLYRTWGVTLPGGSCSTVTAGGHIAGAGFGLLSRRHGLTVDYLYGVEVVVVDKRGRARVIVATREHHDRHRDLWWAHTGGGGGNFGVVTRYLLRARDARGTDPATMLPRPPAEVYLSAVALDWERVDRTAFTTLVRNFGQWHERNSGVDSDYADLFSLLKLNNRTRAADDTIGGQLVLVTQTDATAPNARAKLDAYLAEVFAGVGAAPTTWQARSGEHEAMPELVTPQRLPWLAATLSLAGSAAASRAEYKSAYLRSGHTEHQLNATYEWLTTNYNNPNALAQIDSYGCRINSVAEDATATPHRDSVLKVQYQTYWDDPAQDAEHLGWMRWGYREIYADTGGVPAPVPEANTDGCFINYPDIDLSDPDHNPHWPWSTLYYKGNYPRLRQVKRRYDPLNIFHHAQSVEP